MTHQEALEIVVGMTGHDRYRFLCREDNPDVEQRERCRSLMLKLTGEPIPEVDPAIVESTVPDPWPERIRECDHFNPGCCHAPAFCDLYLINPSREQCISCIQENRNGPSASTDEGTVR